MTSQQFAQLKIRAKRGIDGGYHWYWHKEAHAKKCRRAIEFIESLVAHGVPLSLIATTDWECGSVSVVVGWPLRSNKKLSITCKEFSQRRVESCVRLLNSNSETFGLVKVGNND